ncbi:MAG: tetratricopeptide repeat protein [Planctomycetota bacterium]|jgi:tetratricopeptide (TPR) repeat protein
MVYLEQLSRANDETTSGVHRLQAALQAGTPWRTAVQRISGKVWPDFKAGALQFARAELAERNDADLQAFAKVSTLRMSRRYAETITAADAYLKQFPKSPYRKMGLYHRGRAHHATKQWRKAIADFAAAYAVGTPYTGYDDDLLFWWGWDLYKTGKYADAAAKFHELLRDHPNYNDPTAAAYFWSLALANAGDPGARAALEKTMAAFPTPKESWMMPAAKKALAKLDAAGGK